MMWIVPVAIFIFLYFFVFFRNKNINRKQKKTLLMSSFLLSIATLNYGPSVYVFFMLFFMVSIGVVVQCLHKVKKIDDKGLKTYFELYITLSYIFCMQMVLSWAGVV